MENNSRFLAKRMIVDECVFMQNDCLYEKVNLCDLMFDEMMFTKDIS